MVFCVVFKVDYLQELSTGETEFVLVLSFIVFKGLNDL